MPKKYEKTQYLYIEIDLYQTMELDNLDKKVLYLLDTDGRMSLKAIAKKSHTSSEVVRYRIARLLKEGIIKKFITLVNFSELGYVGHGVFCSFRGEKGREAGLKLLAEHDRVYWLAEFGGGYDLAFAIMAKDTYEFYTTLNRLKEQLAGLLGAWDVAIRILLIQFPRTYLLKDEEKRGEKLPYFGKALGHRKIDGADFKILKRLSQDARLEINALASASGLPPSTVAFRLKRLEQEQVIQGYAPQIACQNYGCQSYQLFLTVDNLDEQKRSEILRYCSANPNIVFLIETLGKWNFELIYEVNSQRELQKQMASLRQRLPWLTQIETGIIFDHYLKYDQFPLGKI